MIRLLPLIILVAGVWVVHADEETSDQFDSPEPQHEQPHQEPSPAEQPAKNVVPSQDAPESWAPLTSQLPPTETPFRGNWFKKRTLLQEMRVSQEALHKMVQEVWIPDHKKFQELYGSVVDQMRDWVAKFGFSEQTIAEVEQQLMALSTTSPVSTSTVSGVQSLSHVMPTSTFDRDSAMNLLKEMRESLQLLGEIKENVMKAVQQAQQQESMGPNFDQQAWKYYEEIDAAYDDLQAARLYEQVRSSEEYLQKLHEYLTQELSPYINHLVGRFDALLKHVDSVYNELIKQGVFLRKEDIPPVKPPAPPVPLQQSWWQWLWSWITAPFYAIARWVASLFGSGKK